MYPYKNILNRKVGSALISIALVLLVNGITLGQSRINYAGRNIFISGMNVAWINFAADLGTAPLDTAKFRKIFSTVHDNGGNVMRLWLFTDGTLTPEYDAAGKVDGPGANAIKDLQAILNIAHQSSLGLQLCLWSHDMMKTSLPPVVLARNINFLIDTSYTSAFLNNALAPLVKAVKGNPAITCWEVFNEPEGFSDEFGWSSRAHVPMADIQRVVNLVAGEIHRIDPGALVTSGANSIQTLTDVNVISKITALENINSLSKAQKDSLTEMFNSIHRTDYTASQFIKYLLRIASIPNQNYYRDDRLIAAGGDSMGTLDYYNVHFYGMQAQSPFNHPYSTWQLTKPLVIGEFFMQDTYGVPYNKLYEQLYQTGYAGAMSWQWWGDTQENDNAKNENHVRTLASLNYMFDRYRNDVIVFPKSGRIYSFSVTPTTIQKGDSALVKWDTEPGAVITLNGESLNAAGSLLVNPAISTKYTLKTKGDVSDSSSVMLTVLPSGQIIVFKAVPPVIGAGESSSLVWQVVKGSAVTLNGQPVSVKDSISVFPDSSQNTYTLIAQGDIRDSSTVTVNILPAVQVDRALGSSVTVSSNDSISYPYSKPENLIDGNSYTRWQANKGNSQWVQLDLGRQIQISKIIIRWYSRSYASTYKVQISDGSGGWQQLYSAFNGTGGVNNVETLDNLSGTGRYAAFLLQVAAYGTISINEIEIYGVPESTGVNNKTVVPSEYSLEQNFPNPFNPTTVIRYSLPTASDVKLTVYNLLGEKVTTLVDERKSAGSYEVNFSAIGGSASDGNASNLSSGIYFYSLRAGNFLCTRKMVLLK